MSFLDRWFGGKKRAIEDGPDLSVHQAYLETLRLPAMALSPAETATLSRIGGLPSLPDDVPWPEWKGKPMAFLCQVDLEAIPQDGDRQGLPASGMLYFFYSQEQETWGFDPKDAGSWRVVHAAAPSGTPRPAPPGLGKKSVFTEKPVALTSVRTYPDWQDDRISALYLNDRQGDQYGDLCAGVFGEHPANHLFGHPAPVQGNDMDLECQLASNGLNCGDASGQQDPRAQELEKDRRDWILLLQLDTDEDAGMMWGDAGMLYFWIRRQDLEQGRFDKCWMILQCS